MIHWSVGPATSMRRCKKVKVAITAAQLKLNPLCWCAALINIQKRWVFDSLAIRAIFTFFFLPSQAISFGAVDNLFKIIIKFLNLFFCISLKTWQNEVNNSLISDGFKQEIRFSSFTQVEGL